MQQFLRRVLVSTALLTVVGASAYAASTEARNPEAVQRLEAERGGTRVSINPATGTARFVRLPASGVAASAAAPSAQAMRETAAAFINQHAQAFGRHPRAFFGYHVHELVVEGYRNALGRSAPPAPGARP